MNSFTPEDFVNILQRGLRETYRKSVRYTDNLAELQKTEYLATICIADALDQSTISIGVPLSIRLELTTEKVADYCVPRVSYDGKTFRRRKDISAPNRTGRVDIAILQEMPFVEHSVFAVIEVKGINPSKQLVLSDLKRNCEFFVLSDISTGKSTIKFSALTSIQRYHSAFEEQLERRISKTKNKYESYLRDLDLTGINYDVDVRTISSILLNDNMTEYEIYSTSDYIHMYLGIVVLFYSLLLLKFSTNR